MFRFFSIEFSRLVIGCNEPQTTYDSIFGGHLLDVLTCKKCGKVFINEEFVLDLSIDSLNFSLVVNENRAVFRNSVAANRSSKKKENNRSLI